MMYDTLPSPPETEDFPLRSLLEQLDRPSPRPGTIAWVHAAAPAAEPFGTVPRDAFIDEFLRFTAGFVAPALPPRVVACSPWRRPRGVALACGLVLTTLACGVVIAAWTDVAAAPALRAWEPELTIAAVEPSEEVARPRAAFFVVERIPSLVIDGSCDLEGALEASGTEPGRALAGPVGRDGARDGAAEVEPGVASRATEARSTRSAPFGRRSTASRERRPGAEVTAEGPDAAMTFGRDELELPRTLSHAQVSMGLRSVSRLLRNCSQASSQRTARVDLVIRGTTGRVADVRVRGFLGETTVGACVARALERVDFPRFHDPELELSGFPLVLR